MKKIKLATLLLSFSLTISHTATAETNLTCPSISSVKNLQGIWPKGPWLPLYTKNGELASTTDVENFSKTASQLALAEWNSAYPEAGHCYYFGDKSIVLAREMLKPNTKLYPKWHFASDNRSAKCLSPTENDCPFGGAG